MRRMSSNQQEEKEATLSDRCSSGSDLRGTLIAPFYPYYLLVCSSRTPNSSELLPVGTLLEKLLLGQELGCLMLMSESRIWPKKEHSPSFNLIKYLKLPVDYDIPTEIKCGD
ncbi:hypothetical protein L6452_00606 [Arctium lappa]|uniref:Uncharacterized protein n=1 Tax=Arctium lappa TaxID=4217 RepID=A0ACB9FED7_ARCLA|nr:hypothetical protein L6452_00606 [Arctium lappa]